eukprot:9668384-Heterocapsa_arctica.AAC.1
MERCAATVLRPDGRRCSHHQAAAHQPVARAGRRIQDDGFKPHHQLPKEGPSLSRLLPCHRRADQKQL